MSTIVWHSGWLCLNFPAMTEVSECSNQQHISDNEVALVLQAFMAPQQTMLITPPTAPRVFRALGMPKIPVATVYLTNITVARCYDTVLNPTPFTPFLKTSRISEETVQMPSSMLGLLEVDVGMTTSAVFFSLNMLAILQCLR